MSGSGPLINIGELSKPVTVLIEKISDAIGGIFQPHQIRRVAQANAEAQKLQAATEIEITDLQRRALQRMLAEEAKKQVNMETVTQIAIATIENDAPTENVADDWISHFFDKCRLISDTEMQQLWAAVLAGEANSPGRFSKRTVTLLSSLDKHEANLFQTLCSFNWHLGDFAQTVPLVYDPNDEMYTSVLINFDSLKHLDNIGLISFEHLAGYRHKMPRRENITVEYFGTPVLIEFDAAEDIYVDTGHVVLTHEGKQLARICESKANADFLPYVVKKWKSMGLAVSCPQAE